MPKDSVAEIQRQMAEARRPRQYRDFLSRPDGNDPRPFTGETMRDARIDFQGEIARDKTLRDNAMYRNQKDTRKGTTLGLIKTLGNMANNEESGRAAARRMGLKGPAVEEYARQWERNTRGSTGFEKPQKPLTLAQQVKMISAMNPKSNGTFKGGSPRSSMSKNLKIK